MATLWPLSALALVIDVLTTSWNGSLFEMPPMMTMSAPCTAAESAGV